jgi:hypothetical protein
MAQKIDSNVFSVVIAQPRVLGVLPEWVPPAGYFADVPMKNNPQDVTPAIYKGDYFGADSPFVMWGGSAVLRDYSPLGAQVYYSGGHEAAVGLPNMQFSLICDFSTLMWSTSNIPVKPNPSDIFDQATGIAPDGTPYTPHTYLGLQEIPAAWGGGRLGSLASFFWGGSVLPNRINVLDVSKAKHGYTQMKTVQPQNAEPSQIRFSRGPGNGNYPITVMDDLRQGWWAATNGNVEYTLFVSKTGEIRQYPALGGNLASGSIVLCPSLNLLITIDGGYVSGSGPRSMHLRDLNSGAVTRSATLGKVPALTNGYDGSINTFHMPDMLGLQWVDELHCIVGIDQTVTPPAIVKLTPPASNPATGSWTWSTFPVQHWPQDANGQMSLQVTRNGVWSKFRWVASLQAFVLGTAQNRKPQIIKLN